MSTKSHMELLLIENVDNLGIVGDVVKVRAGYARNYLVPLKLATIPTDTAKAKVAKRRADVERQLREKRAQLEKLLEQLTGHEVTLQRSANEQGMLFGSVTQHDIAEALKADGFNITEREIRIGEPLKHLDSYMIPVQLAADLRTEIKVWVVSDKPAEELAENAPQAPKAETTEQPAAE
ncbi:MAG: 50S ribosomal protein L9 [Phycisphaerales bacterium]